MASFARRALVGLVAITLVSTSARGADAAAPASVVAAIGSPAHSAAPDEVTCPPNDNNPALGSGLRCIAEKVLSTRRHLLATCFDARALRPNELYGPTECKNGQSDQVEAIAQTRAIVWLNKQRVYGDSAVLPGITPNLQWEVHYGLRPDMVLYDRDYFTRPGAPASAGPGSEIGIIEVKTEKNGGNAGAKRSLDRYLGVTGSNPFPSGPRGRAVVAYNLNGYSDHFRVQKRTCTGNATSSLEHHYTVEPGATPGALIVSLPREDERPCDPSAPPPGDEEEDEEEDRECKICDFPIPIGGHFDDEEDQNRFDAAVEQLEDAAEAGAVLVKGSFVLAARSIEAWVDVCMIGGCAALVSVLADTGLAGVSAVIKLATEALDGMASRQVWGDPHLVSMNGYAYDFHAVGEFHLLQVPEWGVDVQARFRPLSESISVFGGVATEINEDQIELVGSTLKVNGEVVPLFSGQFYDLGDGAIILRHGTRWTVQWPGHGDKLMMMIHNSDIGFHVPRGVDTTGLLGNAGGNGAGYGHHGDSGDSSLQTGPMPDSFLDYPDGTPLPVTASPSTLYGEFAEAWRITQAESFFTYPAGESTATFTDRSFPDAVLTLGDFSEAEIAAASEVCQQQGVQAGPQFQSCVFDVAATGDETYAQSAAKVTDVLVDSTSRSFDATGTLAEDFESTVAPNFASPRYTSDPTTTRIAGPIFDSPGYQATGRSVPRHEAVHLVTDLFAFGQIGDDSLHQSVDVKLGDDVIGTINLEGADGPTLSSGLPGTIERVGVNTTQAGTPYSKFALAVDLPHSANAIDLTFAPKNFRGVLNTSLGVDNIRMSLVVPPADTFDVTLPLSVPSTQAPVDQGAGTLEVGGAQDEYLFDLTTDSTLVLETASCLSGLTAVLHNTTTGTRTALTGSCHDVVSPVLSAGSHRLEVTARAAGSYGLELLPKPAPQVFDYTIGDMVSNGVPAVGAGNLETVASVDGYRFTVPEGGLSLQYQRLTGTKDFRVINRTTDEPVVYGNLDKDFPLPAGDYMLEFPAQAGSGTYSFKLFVVPDPQVFDYAIGDTVSNGVPAVGAGNLETVASVDRYRFTVPDGEMTLHYQRLSGIAQYQVVNQATGAVVATGWNQEQFTLPAGDYQLEFPAQSPPGAYSFKLFAAPDPQVFDYTIGDTVSNGVPASGAGNLETVASVDQYRFTVPPGGGQLQYQRLSGYPEYRVVSTATGDVVATGWNNQQFDLVSGSYLLEFPAQPNAGAYSFQMIQIPGAEVFDYAIGETVANGVPAAGAGNLETIASVDQYRFTVPDGGLALQYHRLTGGMGYQVINRASGDVVASGWDHQSFTLPAGDYNLELRVQAGSSAGTYSFKLFQVPDPQLFDYTIGDTVSNGVPAPGAGNLETIASIDRYRFTVPEGGLALQYQRLSGAMQYQVVNSATGAVVATGWTSNQQITVPAGDYNLEFPAQTATGAYSFKLFVVPDPQVFDYTIGNTVSNGVPAAGAGNLETVASIDRYRFTVPTGGLALQYQRLSGVAQFTVINSATGAVVATGSNNQQFTLPAADYTLEFPAQTNAGTYSFKLFAVPDPQVFDYTIGNTVSNGVPAAGAGNLETIASVDRYRFTVPAGGLTLKYQRLSGAAQFRITNRETNAVVVSGGSSSPQVSMPAGDYEVENTGLVAGTYSWKLSVVP